VCLKVPRDGGRFRKMAFFNWTVVRAAHCIPEGVILKGLLRCRSTVQHLAATDRYGASQKG
jgi:hypothetical protein